MNSSVIYSIGDKVNRLTIVGRVRRGKRQEWTWVCRCDCGVDRDIFANSSYLRRGVTKSCGCYSSDNRNTSGLSSGWQSICEQCKKIFTAISSKQRTCSDICRFHLYENKSEPNVCWNWLGNVNNQGYGVVSVKVNGKRKMKAAHRVAYEISNGGIPEGLCVMHSCDNPVCVNPNHLSIGTWGDNNRDRSRKGRSGSRSFSESEIAKYRRMFSGESNPIAKLTKAQALEIKYGHSGESGSQLARHYGVSKTTINNIRSGKLWRDI